MNYTKCTTSGRLIFVVLFSFLTVVGSESVAVGDFLVAPKGAGALIEVPQFRNGRLLADHYAKHVKGVVIKRTKAGKIKKELAKPGGPDLPEFKSLAEYRTAAQQMWTRSPGGSIVERTLANGDRVRWNWENGTFGALSKDGYIRTFFRPDKGYQYFLDALD